MGESARELGSALFLVLDGVSPEAARLGLGQRSVL